MIEKKPCIGSNYKSRYYFYNNARSALKDLLSAISEYMDYTLLLPGYIGCSPKEGSGIFDPVCESRVNHRFYRLNRDLHIDTDYLFNQVNSHHEGKLVVLLVHYFGFVDPKYYEIISFLKKNMVVIVEDAAHAFYTHIVDNVSGRGDYIFYSLHKMLPYENGGALVVNTDFPWNRALKSNDDMLTFFEYNLHEIAHIRKRNARLWQDLLADEQRISIIRNVYHEDVLVTPQSFPILVRENKRYEIYLEMNKRGFGIISLYHTLIPPLRGVSDFCEAKYVSDNILNLPVHQDVSESDIMEMYSELIEVL